ncbi:MAG TPA: PLP-dependent aminotransferase family protein [Acidimicrobiia bacterium]|jgi:2-aminoadipate transaminase
MRVLPTSTIRDLLAVTEQPGMRSLAGGLPEPALFPAERLARAAETVLGSTSALAAGALQYGPTDGTRALREILAAASALHGLPASDPDAFIVTTGSQQALDLVARALLDDGDTVAVDDPCYLGAQQALLVSGARLIGVPVDDGGMNVDALAQRLRAGERPRLVYTVPNFQNPTGAVLTAGRRAALVELAREYGFVIVEDDAYHSLWFDAPPPAPIGALDDDRVVSVGSCSKVLAPGLRVGWMRAPAWLRDTLVRAKQACDLHTSTLTQALVADVLGDESFLDTHLARIRATYAPKAHALAAALDGFGDGPPARGGMFLWRRLSGIDTGELLERAITDHVAFVPGGAFAVERRWNEHLRLSFATLPVAELEGAAGTLRRLMTHAPA